MSYGHVTPMGSWLTTSWDTLAHGINWSRSLPNAEFERIVERNAWDIVRASGGKITIEKAREIARGDQNALSQAYRKDGGPEPGKPGLGVYVAAGGGVLLLALFFLRK